MDPTDAALPGELLGGGPVRVRWLGTAGVEIRAGEHVLLIDPYLTRASLGRCVATRLAPDTDVLARTLGRVDAIVCGHTHFDHVLDVPAIARSTGAQVFGSRSAAALCRLEGVPGERVHEVDPAASVRERTVEVGPFRLTFVPSEHSRLVLGRVPFPGEIDDCDRVPMRAERYRCGAVFGVRVEVAGRTLYHLGSANLVEGALPAGEVDLLMLCVAGWTQTDAFPERVGRAFSPKAVLLTHWDDFFAPLARPARMLPAMRLPTLVDRLAKASREPVVGTLPLLGAVSL